MKTLNFKNEADTEKKVLELTSKGTNFRVIGRKTIVTFYDNRPGGDLPRQQQQDNNN